MAPKHRSDTAPLAGNSKHADRTKQPPVDQPWGKIISRLAVLDENLMANRVLKRFRDLCRAPCCRPPWGSQSATDIAEYSIGGARVRKLGEGSSIPMGGHYR